MKLKLVSILLYTMIPMLVTAAPAADQSAVTEEKVPFNLHSNPDTTDVFAIPLDSSEAELDGEEEELQELQKYDVKQN
ncbi:hypothetical protein [Neochlamydia sp. S13]|uniref:hypothetical protein n=1 Tax=Neochlamydia sp. S13 TaxID=1353976 RepID=UPI0005A67A2B|nr:hypothetical protein [Neochlamydia sp. S13]BBI16349.1 Uncharacterized protein NCS13_1_0154 [Neochlamydia sp. S13]